MALVVLRNGESQDSLLKRFRKKVVKSGVLSTVRRKRWYVSKSEQRRMEKKKAARRIKRRAYGRDSE
jgi:small subunit ribosomal protein S21